MQLCLGKDGFKNHSWTCYLIMLDFLKPFLLETWRPRLSVKISHATFIPVDEQSLLETWRPGLSVKISHATFIPVDEQGSTWKRHVYGSSRTQPRLAFCPRKLRLDLDFLLLFHFSRGNEILYKHSCTGRSDIHLCLDLEFQILNCCYIVAVEIR